MGDTSSRERAETWGRIGPFVEEVEDREPTAPETFPRGSEVHGLDALIAAANADEDGIRLLLVAPAGEERVQIRETLEWAGYGVIAVELDAAPTILARTMFDVAITTHGIDELFDAAPLDLPIVRCDAAPIRGLLLLTAVRDAIRARYS